MIRGAVLVFALAAGAFADFGITHGQERVILQSSQPQGVVWCAKCNAYHLQKVQVAQPSGQVCPKCGKIHSQPAAQSVRSGQKAGDGYPIEYAAPGYESAYQACLRDCQFYAAGNRYPGRFGGHPPGNLIRGLKAGTGYSWDFNRPNHCFYREGHQLVARARLKGPDGKVWYSARYR